MRTIKDPKKRPELRRRAEVEEEEDEETKSNKSTPPKKRKTTKPSSKDESQPLNDSGSLQDNQSDNLSIKSNNLEDDASDISSLKSTPPKKRNYQKLLNKSPDVTCNGDASIEPVLEQNKKTKAKKARKKSGEHADTVESGVTEACGAKKVDTDKRSRSPRAKKKQEISETPVTEKVTNGIDEEAAAKTECSPKGKKVNNSKSAKKSSNVLDGKQPSPDRPKKTPVKKRKVTDADESTEAKAQDEKEVPKSKTVKSKKQTQSEAALELKRQTEEQRNAHSEKLNNVVKEEKSSSEKPKKSPVSKKKIADAVQKDKAAAEEREQGIQDTIDDVAKGIISSDDVNDDNTPDKRETNLNVPNEAVLSDDNAEHSSDESELDTSFDSTSSEKKDEDKDSEIGVENNDVKAATDSKETENDSKSEISIKCNHCGYISRSKGGHTRHLRKCQPEQVGLQPDSTIKVPKIHHCEKCEYTAPRRVLVINHMKSHGIFQCKRCKFRTDSEESLDDHSGQEHKDRSDCKFCKLCNRYVKCSEVPLEEHMKECQGRIPFKCPECSKEFQYESSLKCHVVSHYPDQPKLFSCDQCDYKSNYKANLKKHVRHIHEQRGERNIKCPDCEKLFFTEDNMRRHQKLHSEEKPHKCDHENCDKAFKTANGLKFHQVSHQTDKPFPCEIEGCGKTFKTKRAVVLHLNETHQNAAKNFFCEEEGCDMAFYKKCHFERHMDAHKDNRTHFCTWITCTKAFKTADALKIHSMVHTDEKPLKCEHCDFACRQKNSIKFHMRKKHPEFLPPDLLVAKTSKSKIALQPNDSESVKTEGEVKTEPVVDSESRSKIGEELSEINGDSDSPSDLNSSGEHVSLVSHTSIRDEALDSKTVQSVASHTHTVISQSSSPLTVSLSLSSSTTTSSTVDSLSTIQSEKNVPSNQNLPSAATDLANRVKASEKLTSEVAERVPDTSAIRKPLEKSKKADMYEFQSEDESGDEMKPGLLRKAYDRDKPPLPPVTGSIDASLLTDLTRPLHDDDKPTDEAASKDKTPKVRKKPGPKPKQKQEKPEEEAKTPKKRGRKKKSETEIKPSEEKEVADSKDDKEVSDEVKPKPSKRGRSPKAKKEEKVEEKKETVVEKEEKEVTSIKKKRGPKRKVKEPPAEEPVVEKVPKKRGRKKKVQVQKEEEKEEDIDPDPENGDATINYSEVESSEMFADSKDSVSDNAESVAKIRTVEPVKPEEPLFSLNMLKDTEPCESVSEKLDKSGSSVTIAANGDDDHSDVDGPDILPERERTDERRTSDHDSESSDIGSDFDDLKPPPAPRPPPMYESEDGDIESGPENEECNGSAMSNEPLRDFESSREISREISRDFESSREIDDSVKTNEYINSVETSTPKEAVGTPGSANPYKNDSVNNDYENQETPMPHSHHSSVAHTPSHNSVPTTPSANQEYESHVIDNTRVKNPAVQRNTNDENTDESSMPEVDKDYVGRFFEEIQCTQVGPEQQITRLNNIDEPTKSQTDKIPETPQEDSGVPSSMGSSQTEASLQMQSPSGDLSHKRMEILANDRPAEVEYQPRPSSSQRLPSDRLPPSVPAYSESHYPPIDPFASSALSASRDTILRQTEQTKVPSPTNPSTGFMRFPPESEAMLQRQRMATPFDRNSIQNLHRITDSALPQHNNTSPLLRHMPGREDVFPGAAGMTGSMSRNPFHASWSGQDVRPPHWSHAAYLQRPLEQQSSSSTTSLFGKDSYLPGREFMFDPSTRAAAERNMFSSLASSHTQRPDIAHDTFQFERFDLGSYLSSHGYNAPPSLPVDYTRSAHSSSQKSLDERYRQSSTGVTDFRSLPQTSSTSDMFGMNSSFNLEKFYPRDAMYHSQHIPDNTNSPFLTGVPSQHPMFSRDYTAHRGFYSQNSPYSLMNMNDKNYTAAAASAKLGHAPSGVTQQRDLVPVPRPNMSASDPQLQDPYRHHSSMLYNMMNRYFD